MADGRTAAPVLMWQQVRSQNRLFCPTPVATFFTLAFPLMFHLLFSVLFGTEDIEMPATGERVWRALRKIRK